MKASLYDTDSGAAERELEPLLRRFGLAAVEAGLWTEFKNKKTNWPTLQRALSLAKNTQRRIERTHTKNDRRNTRKS